MYFCINAPLVKNGLKFIKRLSYDCMKWQIHQASY